MKSKLKVLPESYDYDEKKKDQIRFFITSIVKNCNRIHIYQNDPKSQFEIQSSSFLLKKIDEAHNDSVSKVLSHTFKLPQSVTRFFARRTIKSQFGHTYLAGA